MEVQAKRGALHWHAIGIGGPLSLGGTIHDISGDQPAEVKTAMYRAVLASRFRELWLSALDRLGPAEGNLSGPSGKNRKLKVQSRRDWPGAKKRAFQAEQSEPWRVEFMRYLIDHVSKRKQGQVGSGVGRHWGIVGRKLFAFEGADEVIEMKEKVYWKALRMWRRMARRHVNDSRCPFGWRKGRKTQFGSMGSCVRFENPDIVRQIVQQAEKESGVVV